MNPTRLSELRAALLSLSQLSVIEPILSSIIATVERDLSEAKTAQGVSEIVSVYAEFLGRELAAKHTLRSSGPKAGTGNLSMRNRDRAELAHLIRIQPLPLPGNLESAFEAVEILELCPPNARCMSCGKLITPAIKNMSTDAILTPLDYSLLPSYRLAGMPTEPVCPNILFCDLVITEHGTGKSSFIGCFPGLGSPQFPLQIPRFFVVATVGNLGGINTINATINIRIPSSGAVIASVTAQLQRALNAPTPPHGVDLFDLSLCFVNVMFPMPGLYEAVILLAGEEVAKRPLPIFQAGLPTPLT
jgi:hypothetical protein